MQIKAIVCDIEGTTTAIDYVHKELFPYSAKHLQSFIHEHYENSIVKEAISNVIKYVDSTEKKTIRSDEAINYLHIWIKNDLKQKDLKTIQGLIWKKAYEHGDIKGHVYEDVKPTFDLWTQKNIQIAIYSSGSVQAQKDLFKYSCVGDLSHYIKSYFDTTIGHKREVTSYINLSDKMQIAPDQLLFLSDIAEELEAARQAKINVIQILRPGTFSDQRFKGYKTFLELTSDLFNWT